MCSINVHSAIIVSCVNSHYMRKEEEELYLADGATAFS